MKNLSLFIIGLLIGALSVYFFCCINDAALIEEEIIKPNGLITPSEAKTLDRAFNTRHQLISDSIVKRPDNRSSWYALEDMRNYLNYAEKQAKDLGYTMDGVRVYLGAYPEVRDQVGYTTMFFIPTGYQITSEGGMTLSKAAIQKGGDISGGDGLNMGDNGIPPGANYPQ